MTWTDRIFLAIIKGIGIGAFVLFALIVLLMANSNAPAIVMCVFAFGSACGLFLVIAGEAVHRDLERRPSYTTRYPVRGTRVIGCEVSLY